MNHFVEYYHLNNIKSLPIHDHETSSHWLRYSFISFSSLYFHCTRLASLVKFIFRYFMLLDAIVNGIVFLIFCFHCSLLVHKNTIDFCVLILYPVASLNLCDIARRFRHFDRHHPGNCSGSRGPKQRQASVLVPQGMARQVKMQ